MIRWPHQYTFTHSHSVIGKLKNPTVGSQIALNTPLVTNTHAVYCSQSSPPPAAPSQPAITLAPLLQQLNTWSIADIQIIKLPLVASMKLLLLLLLLLNGKIKQCKLEEHFKANNHAQNAKDADVYVHASAKQGETLLNNNKKDQQSCSSVTWNCELVFS